MSRLVKSDEVNLEHVKSNCHMPSQDRTGQVKFRKVKLDRSSRKFFRAWKFLHEIFFGPKHYLGPTNSRP